MATDKPPFKLSIDLETFRPEALNETLARLRELCAEHKQTTGELKTKVVIESWTEDALVTIRNAIEIWLRVNKTIISGEATLKGPLVRPKVEPTPMEEGYEEAFGSVLGARRR